MNLEEPQDEKIQLWHSGNCTIRIPDLTIGREDVDFGGGFYLTRNYEMSAKWACRKATSICNEYVLSLDGLSVHRFNLDQEWLDYVIANRRMESIPEEYNQYDVIIGAVQNLEYVGHVRIQGADKDKFKNLYREDRITANERTQELLRQINQERRER